MNNKPYVWSYPTLLYQPDRSRSYVDPNSVSFVRSCPFQGPLSGTCLTASNWMGIPASQRKQLICISHDMMLSDVAPQEGTPHTPYNGFGTRGRRWMRENCWLHLRLENAVECSSLPRLGWNLPQDHRPDWTAESVLWCKLRVGHVCKKCVLAPSLFFIFPVLHPSSQPVSLLYHAIRHDF